MRETDLEKTVPAAGTQRNTVSADAQTADAIIVSGEHADSLALERIPDIDIIVVVAGKEDSARGGECDRGDSAEDVVVGVRVELAVRAQIKELARGVVGSGRKGIAVREEPAIGVQYSAHLLPNAWHTERAHRKREKRGRRTGRH